LHCRRNDLCTRLDLARKFKAMYRSLGMDLPQCAKFLHVTERTLHNWESGKHDIPYATFKLLRLMNGLELPGKTWVGWSFHGGKLWSPEGRSFEGTDGSWWSLLVRQAHGFRELVAKGAADRAGGGKAEPTPPPARPAVAPAVAANQPNFVASPMVITGITHGVSYRGMLGRAA
jgi:DNA-binding XRE family transcriptional regulator